eukprot:TRINITY_DN34356_c0_g1_i1.p1 TRINITY_DN34356_c0_g1~~TRINITY_DN34356_c0_g1_i1.p1  ORF type:complete len:248 (-),score=33.95 TRINITY_DN34356_c0_g1_i1:28-771(-)
MVTDNRPPKLVLNLRSVAGDLHMTVCSAKPTWTSSNIVQRLVREMPLAPGRFYKLAIDRRVLSGNLTLEQCGCGATGTYDITAIIVINEALPELERARAILAEVDTGEIDELASFAGPLPLMCLVIEAVCIILDIKGDRPSGEPDILRKKTVDYWQAARRELFLPRKLVEMIVAYDIGEHGQLSVDHKRVLAKLSPYMTRADFSPDNISQVHPLCGKLCKWAHAVHHYLENAATLSSSEIMLPEVDS